MKKLLLILSVLLIWSASSAQINDLCRDGDTVKVKGNSSNIWFGVRNPADCDEYTNEGTCNASSGQWGGDCVWLIQICIPNSITSDTSACAVEETFEDCNSLSSHGCEWVDGECALKEYEVHYYLDTSNFLLAPSQGAKIIVRDTTPDLNQFGFIVSDLEVCPTACITNSILNVNSCTAYTAPSGDETYSKSGTYNDTIPNNANCDSIITIHLTIAPTQEGIAALGQSTICTSGAAEIIVPASQEGYSYSLKNDLNQTIDGPLSGNGTSLTLQSNVISTTSNYSIYAEQMSNTALEFDNIDDRVSVSPISIDTSFTIEIWAKRRSSNSHDYMVHTGPQQNDNGLHIGFQVDGSLRFAFWFNDINLAPGPHSTDGLWHHYAFVYDDVALMKYIYVDGVQLTSGPSNRFLGNGGIFYIGEAFNASRWDGSLDELKIWNVVRTQNEIEASAYECLTGTESGLIAYFDFEVGENASNLYNRTDGPNGQLINMDVDNAWVMSGAENCSSFCSNTVTAVVNQPSSSSISEQSCFSYQSPSGQYLWATSGFYKDTISNSTGCDSVITIDLTINTIDTTLTDNAPELISNEVGATYQWLDCNDDKAPLTEETDKSFTASTSGSYAVEISKNGCEDTSECKSIVITSILENNFSNHFVVYPNPTDGALNIDFDKSQNLTLELKTIKGESLKTFEAINSSHVALDINDDPGIYILEITNRNQQRSVIRIIKK